MATVEIKDKYLVWSNEHRRWWGPDYGGYAKRLCDAGYYTREEAVEICRGALCTAAHMGIFAELPVRLEDVVAFVQGQLVPGELL